ncbi:MAG: hypothetical protein P4M13_11825 [Alphaproteobacteria bacterium]|nr:hypothetical protein [Alphaproteobacteria bacterium]
MNCAASLKALIAPLKTLAVRLFSRKAVLTGMMLLCIMSVCACGKKPAHVDVPEDAGDTVFPAVYPNPAMNK